MKKYIFLALMIILIFPLKIILFAEDTLEKNWFELYEQRVEKICKIYLYETKEKKVQIKKIIKTEDFQKARTPSEKKENIKINNNEIDWPKAFEIAKETYEENMNNIYKCWVLTTQLSTLNLIKKDILSLSNNPDLSKEVEVELDNKITKIELSIKKFECKTNNENKNDWIQKLNILKQTTYELCKYHSYLEYLREYNSKYENIVVLDDDTDYNSMYLVNLEQNRKNQIDNEINHIYKIYPIAFNAYKQYEDNLSTHLLLELIKDDYKILRDNLHKVLNPINQVIYKVSNATQP